MEKMTYVSVIESVINGETLNAEQIEKLSALKESLIKRNSRKSDKPTKKQRESAEMNERLGAEIIEKMEIGTTYQTSELAEMVDVSTSRMVQIIKSLGDKVIKGEESRKGKGRVTVYSIA